MSGRRGTAPVSPSGGPLEPVAALGVEEVEAPRVDGKPQPLADRDGRILGSAAVKSARWSVASSTPRSPSSDAARTASVSTGGASIGKIACVAEPSSSTTAGSTSIVASRGRRFRGGEILRPDAEHHVVRPRRRAGAAACEPGELDHAVADARFDEVHRRRSDERRDEQVRGRL